MRLQNDAQRISQLHKSFTKPGHPYSKLNGGNKSSLTEAARNMKAVPTTQNEEVQESTINEKGNVLPSPILFRDAAPTAFGTAESESDTDGGHVDRETRRRLIEWWTKEYCASRMSLALIGKESLDELSKYVTKYFSPIVNRGEEPCPSINDHPFGENDLGKVVFVNTVIDTRSVELSFPIPYMIEHWRVKPAEFISHFVGHQGPGSLYGYLKSKGWITAIRSWPHDMARGFSMLRVWIYLTKDGFSQSPTFDKLFFYDSQAHLQSITKKLSLPPSSTWISFAHLRFRNGCTPNVRSWLRRTFALERKAAPVPMRKASRYA